VSIFLPVKGDDVACMRGLLHQEASLIPGYVMLTHFFLEFN
jgi:hypothetical protein